MSKQPEQNCPELSDIHAINLEDLQRLVNRLQWKYGKKALIILDASANNIDARVVPNKKQKVKK